MKTIVTYVPHGPDTDVFTPITDAHPSYEEYKKQSDVLRSGNSEKFIIVWNNRNIHRKHGADVIVSYKAFCEKLVQMGGKYTRDYVRDNCLLVMHTVPRDPNGTDLPAVVSELCPDFHVMFSPNVVPPQDLNVLYNVADVVLNISSNEGFGITTTEAMAAGTPVIVNVTGGLQDQCGFINPNTNAEFTENDYIEIGSLHDRNKHKNLQHGKWVIPVFPISRSVQGSIPTPYIFDDRVDYNEVADALLKWFMTDKKTRELYGMMGRKYLLRSNIAMNKQDMCERIVRSIDATIENFKPRLPYELIKV